MHICQYACMQVCCAVVYVCMNVCMRCRTCVYVCMHVELSLNAWLNRWLCKQGNLVRHYVARQFSCPGEPDFMSDQGFRLDRVLDMLTYHFLCLTTLSRERKYVK